MASQQTQTRPTIICGPSGVGKRTLIAKLRDKFPFSFGITVSHTTRKRRDTELANIDYFFITKEEFESDINNNLFIEYAIYDNEYYGTSYKSIESLKIENLICLLEIDCNGAQTIKKDKKIECNYLFISTSNGIDTLKERMIERNTENMEQIQRRLEIGKKEFKFLNENPNFFDAVIYNDKDIDETIYLLTEQFLTWYPELKQKMEQKEDTKQDEFDNNDQDDDDTDQVSTLANISGRGRMHGVSKRQSMDLYADFNHKGDELFITNESLCRQVLNSQLSPFQHNDHIHGIIIEYTDISPRNRRKQWKNINEFSVIINKLKSTVEHRWTIGNNIHHYPQINIKTINEIYFAYHEQIINGYLFYLCGTVKCPEFAKKYYDVNIEDIENDWDSCWDVYFYMKVDTEFRGSVQFSRVWTNMLIFGIDSDAVRQASESGIWKLNTKQSNNFLIRGGNGSTTSSLDNIHDIDENELIIDEEDEQQ